MAITDERTPRLNLPLPYSTNTLKDDVERLRQSFSALDTKVATVGDDGKIPTDQLPSIALSDTYPVNSESEMLALDAQPGSLAIRADVSKTFVLMALPASTLANWKEMLNDALVQISQPDGFKNIGSVPSYANLKQITPSYAGQQILLTSYYEGWAAELNPPTGGGKFVSIAGAGIEDGGHICVPNGSTSFYWVRATDEVKLTDYGVKTFSWNANNVTLANDQSDKVNAACRRAVLTGFPLIAPPASYNNGLRGIPVLKTIDITNVREIRGDLLLFAHNLRGTYTNDLGLTTSTGVDQPFVLVNMNGNFAANGGYVFSSVKGPRTYDTIRTINLGDRTTRLNGQLHFFASTLFSRAFADGFNGWGIRWGIIQDSIIEHQSESGCGNINQFALYAYSYPVGTGSSSDFCNNVTFKSIICEYSQDRSVFISGPAVHYERIHEEGTIVSGATPDAWGVHSIDSYAAGYGSKIANLGLALNNGSGSQLNIIDLNGLSTASFNAVLNMPYTEFGMVHATRSSSDKTYLTNVIVATGWSGDGGSIESIHADQVYVGDTASRIGMIGSTLLELRGPNVVVERAAVKYLNLYSGTVKNFSGSSTGYANLGGSTYPARLVDSTILNAPLYLDTSSSADVIIDNCHIASTVTRGRYDGSTVTAAGTRPVRFSGCTFPNALDLPSAGALMEFSDCAFANLVLGTGTYYQIHKGSRITALTKNAAAWGLWAFDDSTVVQSMNGAWAWPDTAYNNYNLRVYSPITGRSRKNTTYGWVDHDGPVASATATFTGIATKTLVSQAVAVADTIVGDMVSVAYAGNTNGLLVWGQVTTAGTVTIYVFNPTAGSLDLSGTFKIKVV